MIWIRQILSFSAVGFFATLAHVAATWMLIELARCNPYSANLLGTCAAFAFSFFGNASFTFRADRSLWNSAKRYLCISLFSLVMTSAILVFVKFNDLPIYLYFVMVFATVPPATFLLAKFWAFKPQLHSEYVIIQSGLND